MASHRSRAQFERARWRAAILVPIWTLQLLLTASMMALFAWRLGHSLKNGGVPAVQIVGEAINVAMSLVAALCTLFEAARYLAEALTPWTVLFTHVVKLACAAAICVLDAVVYSQGRERFFLVGLGLDVALLDRGDKGQEEDEEETSDKVCNTSLTAIALAAYAIVTYRRLSRFQDYVHHVNVKGFGFRDNDSGNSSPPTAGRSLGTRASALSSRFSPGPDPDRAPAAELHTFRPALSSRYTHERDTQFDEYVARRSSLDLRLRLEHSRRDSYASGGSGAGSKRAAAPSVASPPPTGIAVGTCAKGASIVRAISYTSDHVLLAVPEEEDIGGAEAHHFDHVHVDDGYDDNDDDDDDDETRLLAAAAAGTGAGTGAGTTGTAGTAGTAGGGEGGGRGVQQRSDSEGQDAQKQPARGRSLVPVRKATD
ncbi:hypothetical protein AAL_05193 [Moelleriella libera RCEF 2490]|uniref:Uncharacterized protein n=1 Tax=Moelleriella libera RCEF 2490 TaxID=1081109 RepID=A0A168AQZ9_9HYPO|nr:hypothetical protein AAL_05193 [Moelleriella libera RCEF 2490]